MRDSTLTKRTQPAGSQHRDAQDPTVADPPAVGASAPKGQQHPNLVEPAAVGGRQSEKTAASDRDAAGAREELVVRATRGLIRLERRRRRRVWLRRLFFMILLAAALGGAGYLLHDRLPPIDWQQYLRRLPLRGTAADGGLDTASQRPSRVAAPLDAG